MNLNSIKNQVLATLEESNVNLGRKSSKTRSRLLLEVKRVLDKIDVLFDKDTKKEEDIEQSRPNNNSVMPLRPKNNTLDIGKGVHSMTPTESAKADRECGYSPGPGGEQ